MHDSANQTISVKTLEFPPPSNRHASRDTSPKLTPRLQTVSSPINLHVFESITRNHIFHSRADFWHARLRCICQFMLVRVPGCHEGGECSGVALIDERLRFLDRVYLVPLIGVLGLAYAYGVGGEWEEEGRGERDLHKWCHFHGARD